MTNSPSHVFERLELIEARMPEGKRPGSITLSPKDLVLALPENRRLAIDASFAGRN